MDVVTALSDYPSIGVTDYYTPKKPVVHEKGTTGSQ